MRALLQLLFPARCVACDRLEPGVRFFCQTCAPELEPLPRPRCERCGEPGNFPRATCPRCHLEPPSFARAEAAYVHGGAVARAIHAFKYQDRPELAGELGSLLVERCADFLAGAPRAVCALPLHRARFRQRKYDQAQLLARAVARGTGRRFFPRALTRVRDTARQVDLSETARRANVSGAFVGHPSVRGERVLLVDDVLTTGATADAAGEALLRAGAREVQVLTLARAWSG